MKPVVRLIEPLALAAALPLLFIAVSAVLGDVDAGTLGAALILGLVSVSLVYIRLVSARQLRRLRRLERSQLTAADVDELRLRMLSEFERMHAATQQAADLVRGLTARVAQIGVATGAAVPAARSDSGTDLIAAIRESQHKVSLDVRRGLERTFEQIEALDQLRAVFQPVLPLPPTRGWAASPDLLLLLVELVRRRRPRTIVECGSGASTIWLAYALRTFDIDGRIVSLEHETDHAGQTAEYLEAHGLDDLVDLRVAELEVQRFDGADRPWYAQPHWKDLRDVDLVLVDGPPATTGSLARCPALFALAPALADGATVILDDLIRQDEKDTVELWQAAFPGLDIATRNLEKGCAILTWSR